MKQIHPKHEWFFQGSVLGVRTVPRIATKDAPQLAVDTKHHGATYIAYLPGYRSWVGSFD
ncbi:MAG: hypothetical protein MK384_08600 [SAR202 cluster bacterium]|nr:hypothetical protein [SAR202 cluster bacterium]